MVVVSKAIKYIRVKRERKDERREMRQWEHDERVCRVDTRDQN
jgi:hypothetical protein